MVQLTLFDGASLRDHGMTLTSSAHQKWCERADRAIRTLAHSQTQFTSDDVIDCVGMPSGPNAVGARMMAASKRGIIKLVGYKTSERRSRHAGRIGVWEGK